MPALSPAALAAANAVATANRGLAYTISRAYRPKGMDADEALSLAFLALINASRHHDPARGTLGTLTTRAYRQQLAKWHAARNCAHRRGRFRTARLGTRQPVDRRPDPSRAVDAADAVAYLKPLLSPAEWDLLHRRYFRGQLLDGIARDMPGGPVTRQRACQKMDLALNKARLALFRADAL